MIYNTIFALLGSTMMAFMTSALLKHGKMSFWHILFCSLSGGVAISWIGSILIYPFAALLVGALAGFLSVITLNFMTICLERWKFFDNRGTFYVHGFPALISAVLSIPMLALLPFMTYPGVDAPLLYR